MDSPIACPLPWNAPKTAAISVDELASRREAFTVLDVREPEEFAEGAIPGSILMPLGTVPAQMAQIPKDRPVACVCAVGGRSARATALLRERGFDAYNVAGGIRAWLMHGHPVA